jgi:hypothetical protein
MWSFSFWVWLILHNMMISPVPFIFLKMT